MKNKYFLIPILIIIAAATANAETIGVLIKGRDDGVKTNKQQDYKEAVMNAKIEAIERAGAEISSITKVVNFNAKYDIVESKAKAVLLPGFQIMDIGYQVDGTYQVVLSGQVKQGEEKIKGCKKQLSYAKVLKENYERYRSLQILKKITKSCKSGPIVEEAIYLMGFWDVENANESIMKLKAYYPNSNYIIKLTNQYKEYRRKSFIRKAGGEGAYNRKKAWVGKYREKDNLTSGFDIKFSGNGDLFVRPIGFFCPRENPDMNEVKIFTWGITIRIIDKTKRHNITHSVLLCKLSRNSDGTFVFDQMHSSARGRCGEEIKKKTIFVKTN